MSSESIPYLYDLMEDLINNGVKNVTLNPDAPVPSIEIPEGSYTITDNEMGVKFAEEYDTGYLYYSSKSYPHQSDLRSDSLPSTDALSASKRASKCSTGAFCPNRGKPLKAECVIEGFDEVTADFIEKMFQRKNGIPWTILETERTILREITLSDINDLFELYKDPDIIRFIPPLQLTREEELDFQREYIKHMYGFFGYGFWNVLDKNSKKLIGRAGLSNREGFEDMELGYLFTPDYRGKGIATEVCTAIIKYAADILGAEKLNAFIHPENTKSVRLAEKLGFKYTGEEIESMGNVLVRYVLDVN